MELFNDNKMNDNAFPFLGGFAMSSIGSISFLDNITIFLQVQTHDILVFYLVKILTTLFLGLVGGLAGMLAKDLYIWAKKKYIRFINKK